MTLVVETSLSEGPGGSCRTELGDSLHVSGGPCGVELDTTGSEETLRLDGRGDGVLAGGTLDVVNTEVSGA